MLVVAELIVMLSATRRTYLSAYVQNLSLPNSTYCLDVLVRIGYLTDYYHLPYARIQEQLPSHIQVSTRHLQNLYKEYLALLRKM